PRDKFRIQCFRAAVEWVVANHGDDGIRRQRSALVPSSVTTAEGMTFEEYVRHALARHPEIAEAVIEQNSMGKRQIETPNKYLTDSGCDERVRRFVDQVENEWRRFLVVHCLRLLFAPLVEHLLIMDRVEFLKDHGHQGTAELGTNHIIRYIIMVTIDVRGVQIMFPFPPYECQVAYMEKVIEAIDM
ncbi:hypothetical protein OSTOST_25188, partial [Ostertagia ostertagi]